MYEDEKWIIDAEVLRPIAVKLKPYGLVPLATRPYPSKLILCRCLACGVDLTYRLKSVIRQPFNYPVCRACLIFSGQKSSMTDIQQIEKPDVSFSDSKLRVLKIWMDKDSCIRGGVIQCFRCGAMWVEREPGTYSYGHTYLRRGWIDMVEHTCIGYARNRVGRIPVSEYPGLCDEWDAERNGNLDPSVVNCMSRRKIWWTCFRCSYSWIAAPYERFYTVWLCPKCRSVFDCLALEAPDLAGEWSERNPFDAWQVRPTSDTYFLPEWVCANNEEHVWNALLSSRWNGAGCPKCRDWNHSKVEKCLFDHLNKVYKHAKSGTKITDKRFISRKSWEVDISFQVNDEHVAVEYDGTYWHRNKVNTDVAKSLDLLRAGWVVIRIRTNNLPSLDIDDARYHEIRSIDGIQYCAENAARIIALVNALQHSL